MDTEFGTIIEMACECSGIIQDDDGNILSLIPHILGGDDEWYCSKCEQSHYDYINTYYNGK